jgi:hypothetical protein
MTGKRLRKAGVLAAATTAAAALSAPAIADAAVFCVGPVGCSSGNVGNDLQAGLTAAQVAPGPDRVLIADRGSPYLGPFSYVGDRTNTVEIAASGTGRPLLTAGVGDTVLNFADGSLEGVDVRSASSAAGTGIAASSANIRDVTVSAIGTAEGGHGISACADVSLENTRIVNHGDSNLDAVGRGEVTARDLRLENANTGVIVASQASLDVRVARISSRLNNAFMKGVNTVISRGVLTTTDPEAVGIAQDGGLPGAERDYDRSQRPGGRLGQSAEPQHLLERWNCALGRPRGRRLLARHTAYGVRPHPRHRRDRQRLGPGPRRPRWTWGGLPSPSWATCTSRPRSSTWRAGICGLAEARRWSIG